MLTCMFPRDRWIEARKLVDTKLVVSTHNSTVYLQGSFLNSMHYLTAKSFSILTFPFYETSS